jgi:hypothetical protein
MSETISTVNNETGEIMTITTRKRKASSTLKKTHIAIFMSEEKKSEIQEYCDQNDKSVSQLGRELFEKEMKSNRDNS